MRRRKPSTQPVSMFSIPCQARTPETNGITYGRKNSVRNSPLARSDGLLRTSATTNGMMIAIGRLKAAKRSVLPSDSQTWVSWSIAS